MCKQNGVWQHRYLLLRSSPHLACGNGTVSSGNGNFHIFYVPFMITEIILLSHSTELVIAFIDAVVHGGRWVLCVVIL